MLHMICQARLYGVSKATCNATGMIFERPENEDAGNPPATILQAPVDFLKNVW